MTTPRERLDPDLLDQDDPFEIDFDNETHMLKHGYSRDDLVDVWYSEPLFYPAKDGDEADWLMVAEVPGALVLSVPIAPPRSGDHRRCRPIGIYKATSELAAMYRKGGSSDNA